MAPKAIRAKTADVLGGIDGFSRQRVQEESRAEPWEARNVAARPEDGCDQVKKNNKMRKAFHHSGYSPRWGIEQVCR